jgi:hypothetical protein
MHACMHVIRARHLAGDLRRSMPSFTTRVASALRRGAEATKTTTGRRRLQPELLAFQCARTVAPEAKGTSPRAPHRHRKTKHLITNN